MQRPLLISYFTRGTLYEKDAQELLHSCHRHGVEIDLEPVDSLGSWDRNCCYKPTFILRKLRQHQRPVVWVDADALLLQKPSLFDTLTCDLAVRICPDRDPSDPGKVLTGTVYVAPTEAGINLLQTWIEVCEEALASRAPGQEVWDQICLRAILQHLKPAGTIVSLPIPYCAVSDAPEDQPSKKKWVIVHHQASRLYKKFINGEVSPFLSGLSAEELRELRPKVE
ncbi:MAG: hypothetical protein KGJ02_01210 [Verrucomicrobiota bacterium]|nr:hypothetical protein [Verrucomicrobiota bacterium]